MRHNAFLGVAALVGLFVLSCSAPLPAREKKDSPIFVDTKIGAVPKSQEEGTLDTAGITGGLCVMIGCDGGPAVARLAAAGRYLVHVLEPDEAAVDGTRAALHGAAAYGLASAELLSADGRLPYTENLVNAVFLGPRAAGRIAAAEIARVLRPEGLLLVADKGPSAADLAAAGLKDVPGVSAASWRCLRKPWPESMDAWTHPRHAADGNAVSRDTLVAPPRRVRWVTGPQQEISNMVTAGGRAFFAGVLSRDAFNGLRLWEQKLNPSPARGGYGFRALPGSALPVATEKTLLVVTNKKLCALDAATGRTVCEYPEAGLPTAFLVQDGTVLAIGKDSVRALDLESGKLRWKEAADQARYGVAQDGVLYFLQGDVAKPESLRLVSRQMADGKLRWQRDDLPWLPKVRQCVCHQGVLVCEISTLNNDGKGNMIHVLSAADGSPLWSRPFVPGAIHYRQARALFIGESLWVLEQDGCVAMDPRTGEVRKKHKAGKTHCFPPVATTRYFIAGEMHLTDLETGHVDGNPITKAACSRDAGIVPANGLLYTFPKHCICWPMLRDYAALAPERPGGLPKLEDLRFVPERGAAPLPEGMPLEDPATQWPCYRHDAYRSGSTDGAAPREPKVLWTATLGPRPEGTVAEDWRGNYFIRGPVGPPVIAAGLVYVARPDAHQVVALDVRTGSTRWTFTANGRVDTAPTIHRGLCLFGCKSGWVYCLRADTGGMVWRLRAAPVDERIVAYGQLESPWPVPGSVLVVDDVAYFAAGRQALADGGILVFAVDPKSGIPRWIQRLHQIPQTNFYASSGLEFDNFDLMHREGDAVAMSRWLFDRSSGKMTCQDKSGFARLGKESGVMFPRGAWSYAPRNETERWPERPFLRPLAVFRGNCLYGCSQDRQTVFRRDFHLNNGDKFDPQWFHGWNTYQAAREGGDLWRSQRLARGAAWGVAPGDSAGKKQPIGAVLLAGDRLYVVNTQGDLAVLDNKDGSTLSRVEVAAPAWDGLAAAEGRLVLTTQDGRVIGLGEK